MKKQIGEITLKIRTRNARNVNSGEKYEPVV
jgi:hypothetical protein